MRLPVAASLLAFVAGVAFAPTAAALTATPTTTEGPYYTLSAANNADKSHFTGEGIDNDLTHIAASSTQCNGTVFLLSGTLVNTAGTPIAGATIELWQADNSGIYWYTSATSGTNNYASRDKNFQGYGTCVTDSSGAWSFRTVRPGLYVGRIRHFHFKVRIGGTVYLTSQFMFSGDSASFASDTVAASLVAAGTMPLVTLTPVSGVDGDGNAALIASKQIVVNYTVAATAPAIATPPAAQSVAWGAGAGFSVVASGTAPLSYQWRKDGTAISGATSASYTIAATAVDDAGAYSVVVSNAAGSATSAAATLTVVTPFAAFATAHGLDPATTGAAAADPDADGVANLLEFVLAGDPNAADPAILPVASFVDPSTLQVSFRTPAALGPVAYAVQVSEDLATWTAVTAGTGGVTATSESQTDGTLAVVWLVPVSSARAFARVVATP